MMPRTEEPVSWAESIRISRGREAEAGLFPSLSQTPFPESTSWQPRDTWSEGRLSIRSVVEDMDHMATALRDTPCTQHSKVDQAGASMPAILALSLSSCGLGANGLSSLSPFTSSGR